MESEPSNIPEEVEMDGLVKHTQETALIENTFVITDIIFHNFHM